MAESVVDQIIADLRRSAPEHYPQRGELKNLRIVGHTPKGEYFIYDVVVDFADAAERIAAKVYRVSKCGQQGARALAKRENANLQRAHAICEKKKLAGVPRPVGDYSELGAVVAAKLSGVPLQSLIMKAALLPGYADGGALKTAARQTGEWLRAFHKVTADMPAAFEVAALLSELEKACESCRSEGLDEPAIRAIVSGARGVLAGCRRALPCSAVLNDFTPLNIIVGEQGVGICDYAHMDSRGNSFRDVAMFLASVEALEKYPFCNRSITSEVQESFLHAYGVSPTEQPVLRVMRMKALLAMFAQGRRVKDSALRKKVMWATVMKRFIHQAAQRSLAPAA